MQTSPRSIQGRPEGPDKMVLLPLFEQAMSRKLGARADCMSSSQDYSIIIGRRKAGIVEFVKDARLCKAQVLLLASTAILQALWACPTSCEDALTIVPAAQCPPQVGGHSIPRQCWSAHTSGVVIDNN